VGGVWHFRVSKRERAFGLAHRQECDPKLVVFGAAGTELLHCELSAPTALVAVWLGVFYYYRGELSLWPQSWVRCSGVLVGYNGDVRQQEEPVWVHKVYASRQVLD